MSRLRTAAGYGVMLGGYLAFFALILGARHAALPAVFEIGFFPGILLTLG